MSAAAYRHDFLKHEPSPQHQKRAVSELVGLCWGIMGLGLLSPEIERQLRARVRNTCIEFQMDPPPERASLEPFPGSESGAFS